jgi:hypothetical protein
MLTTDEMMEEIIARSYAHLLAQGEPAWDKTSGFCRYRTNSRSEKKVSCALGCLIQDKFYHGGLEGNFRSTPFTLALLASNPEWDRKAIPDVFEVYYPAADLYPVVKLLTDLQTAHDEYQGAWHSGAWETYLKTQWTTIAEKFQLTWRPQ